MDSNKDFIRSNKTDLIRVLSTEASFVLQHVQEKKRITLREYNYLHPGSKEHGERVTTELLDKLMNKGDTRCKDFISLLREDKMMNEIPELSDLLLTPPAAPYQAAAGAAASDTPVQKAGLETYKMTSSPRGTCVIINNVDFGNEEKNRKGSDKDAGALKEVFTWLGFTVEPHTNLTADEMKHVLQESSKHAGGDCFICCVLSHGESKGVLGCDHKVLSMEEILNPFRGHVCPGLAGKPKLFFIQACRGKRFQEEATLSSDTAQELDTDDNPSQMITIPTDADFLVCMANVNEYLSFRDTSNGSWFIQSLCCQLNEGVPRGDDIFTILTQVSNKVAQKTGDVYVPEEQCRKKARQISELRSTLRKKLVFPYSKEKMEC